MRLFGKTPFKTLSVVAAFTCLCMIFTDWPLLVQHTGRVTLLDPTGAHKKAKKERSKIAKLSMLYGEPNPLYERALAAHVPHNERFGYGMYVLREKTLPGYWSKPAYILDQILAELASPEDERLEWVVWVDCDTVLMNPNIPLEIFLPPEENWSHIHALVTDDHRGLNNGVFFLRVHPWSVWLMTACLGTEIFDPDIKLQFGDQSAMAMWLKKERFQNNTMHVPQRWFNAYPGYRGDNPALFADPWAAQTKFRANSIREGDLLVHHAGHKSQRTQRMSPWMNVAELHLPQWEMDLANTTYLQEIEEFWQKEAPKERERVDAQIKAEAEKEKKAKAEKLEQEKVKAEKDKAEKAKAEKEEGRSGGGGEGRGGGGGEGETK